MKIARRAALPCAASAALPDAGRAAVRSATIARSLAGTLVMAGIGGSRARPAPSVEADLYHRAELGAWGFENDRRNME